MMITATKKLSPLLRWAGGKYNQPKIIKRLLELYEPYRDSHVWVEPFCGALGATFRVMPYRAILSDSNKWLIRFYETIKDGNNLNPEYFDKDYYDLRKILRGEMARDGYGDCLSRPDFASVFYAVNRKGFNGVWRVNASGEYNVPAGKDSQGRLLTCKMPSDYDQYFAAMDKWSFDAQPWQMQLTLKSNLMGFNRSPKFIYIDPPYDNGFVGYQAGGFTWDDQKELAEWAALSPHPVVMSNLATPRIMELYSSLGFDVEEVSARRSVSRNGDREKVVEILATKNVMTAAKFVERELGGMVMEVRSR